MGTLIDFPVVKASTHRLRLLQLASGTMPVGAFTYSQGLEMAVEFGWIHDADSLEHWVGNILDVGVSTVDVPIFKRLCSAYVNADLVLAQQWIDLLLACRETRELREEERQRGRAFARLLPELEAAAGTDIVRHTGQCQLAGQAWLCVRWGIDCEASIETFTWSWMENLVLAGVKLIPLGQSQGQQSILRLGDRVPAAVANGLGLPDEAIGSGCQSMAIASSLHETQYTRLFRS